jgi:hypothetical protein
LEVEQIGPDLLQFQVEQISTDKDAPAGHLRFLNVPLGRYSLSDKKSSQKIFFISGDLLAMPGPYESPESIFQKILNPGFKFKLQDLSLNSFTNC